MTTSNNWCFGAERNLYLVLRINSIPTLCSDVKHTGKSIPARACLASIEIFSAEKRRSVSDDAWQTPDLATVHEINNIILDVAVISSFKIESEDILDQVITNLQFSTLKYNNHQMKNTISANVRQRLN